MEKIILRMGILQSPIIDMDIGPTRRVYISVNGLRPFFITREEIGQMKYCTKITFIGMGKYIRFNETDIEFFDMEYIEGI